MTQIANTEMHVGTAVIVESFGTDGAARIVPIQNGRPGRAFILEPAAAKALGKQLVLQVDQAVGRAWIEATS